jgi:tetratricopeptide (TPR) repeat protein
MAKIGVLALYSAGLFILCVTASVSVSALPAESPAIRTLLNRAQNQAQSGHLNVAVSTWEQVLASDPVNAEALRSIAAAQVKLGHQAEANAYIQRLQKTGASASVIGQLQSMQARPPDAALLQQASSLAKSGQYNEAMDIYRKLYGDVPPAGDTALVYYDTLAALPSERKHAIEGLRKLTHQFSTDERYAIALGRVLTYDGPTRNEGIVLLRRYPADRNADDALKQALIWSDRTMPPANAAILPAASRSTVSEAPVATASDLGIGFRALNAGNLPEAAEHFRMALAHEATHGQGHAGLGYVQMQQQNFGQAVSEFEKAEQDGDRSAALTQALANSRFWLSMSDAKSALDSNDLEAAIAGYKKALVLKPESADAISALGGTLLRAARPKEAIPFLQLAVRANPGSQAVWRALFVAQSAGSDRSDAVRTAEHMPLNLRTPLDSDPEFLGSLAADYAAVGDTSRSDTILKRALALSHADDDGEWSVAKQLQYGLLLLTAKRYNTAVRSFRQVLTASPDNPQAWRGLITADHLADRDDEALRTFRDMPLALSVSLQKDVDFLSMLAGVYQSQGKIEAARATLTRALKIAPSVSLKLQLASLEMSYGDKQYGAELYANIVEEHSESAEAWLGWIQALHATGRDRDALRQVDEMPEAVSANLLENPEYLQTTALVFSALGSRRRASEAMEQVDDFYAQRGIDPPAGVQLQRGWLLLQSGDNSQLSRVIQNLSRSDDLTPDQQSQVAHLWSSWAVQRASLLAQQGNRSAAVAVLAVALRAFPEDVSLNNALANAYLANGDAKRSVVLYARQDMKRADVAVCVSAINAALVANDRKQAQAWLQSSLDRFDQNAKVLELAARFEEQHGDRQRAAAYDRAALEAEGPPSIAELTASSGVVSQREVGPSARQELFDLLTPATNQQADPRIRALEDSGQVNFPETHTPLHSRPGRDQGNQSQNRSELQADDVFRLPAHSNPLVQENHNGSLRVSEAALDAPSDERVLPAISYGTPASTAHSRHHHQEIARSSQEDDAAAGEITYVSKSEIPHYSRPQSTEQGHLDRVAPDVSTYESQVVSVASDNTSSSTDARGQNYRNAVLSRIISRSQIQMDVTDAESSESMLDRLPAERVEPLPPLTGFSRVVQPLTPRQQTEQVLTDIESSSSSYVGGDSSVGFHSGQSGYDRLTNFSADTEQSTMLGTGARATVVVHPTILQSGTAGPDATFQMGTLPSGAVSGIQTAAGVGGEVQLRTRSFGAALGYTPRGFLVENVTGRLLVQPGNGPVTLSFERQPIEDTQLSYAGLRDLGSTTASNPGNIWGGVISTGGSLLISHSDAVSGWYMQGGGQYITGEHVEQNHRIDGYAGAYWSVWNHPEYGKLTLGMNLFGMHYANNQRLFTYGNGGYFSPDAYLLSSVPITFDGNYNSRFHYKASGSLGLQAFQEGASPYFPIDSALQTAAKNPFTVERMSVGVNYNVEAEGSYLITEHWHVGSSFSLNNSYDYTSDRLSFFLRYAFFPQSTDSSSGPTGLGANRGLRPLFTR